ncbi:hypothetical protein [Amycolatopsis anabasis]|uniref:hypothetical protein n=1 Tax=Amycolatopsis anabasis TaxID=1840409 RepID=UPI00131C00D7|nr:hypothetical protein [Amycolatopsis anabasis]
MPDAHKILQATVETTVQRVLDAPGYLPISMADKRAMAAAGDVYHALVAAGLITTPAHSADRSLRDLILDRCGFAEGAEVTPAGSFDNDLAHERAGAVLMFLDLAAASSRPWTLLKRAGIDAAAGLTGTRSPADPRVPSPRPAADAGPALGPRMS